jgi:hypothetical protein
MYHVAPCRLGASGSTVDSRLAAAIALDPVSDGSTVAGATVRGSGAGPARTPPGAGT